MVGRRIDQILAEKANARNGNFYLLPIVVPVVSSFKRIYKTRLSKNGIFKGKPLHTIEESSENSQNELVLQAANAFINDESSTEWNNLQNKSNLGEADASLSGIKYLFDVPGYKNLRTTPETSICQAEHEYHGCLDSPGSERSLALNSPSVSLMQQFEFAAKSEAAIVIQQWYRQVRERRRFLNMKQSAIIIQRFIRKRLK
eukprot:gene14403-5457_t